MVLERGEVVGNVSSIKENTPLVGFQIPAQHFHDGGFDLGGGNMLELPVPLPYTLGHEIFGEVVATGNKSNVEIGKKFVVYPWIGCGECEICKNG